MCVRIGFAKLSRRHFVHVVQPDIGGRTKRETSGKHRNPDRPQRLPDDDGHFRERARTLQRQLGIGAFVSTTKCKSSY